ncbi:MAG: glutamine synthetase [Alphaproteobacteria bacterium]|nr:glutamine synthetase [Alphaproteobacteria bacterium]
MTNKIIGDYLKDKSSRFATVAMADTNGLLRGQMVSVSGLPSLLKNGMGMALPQLALDPTDELLDMPGVTDGEADFHDEQLAIDQSMARRIPWAKTGHDLLLLSQFKDGAAAICPRSILGKVLKRAKDGGFTPKYGIELEYTLFSESHESARAKGYRDLQTATQHKSHDLIIYQATQSEWYQAVAEMCEPLGINLAKMHEEIGGGFMEACIAAGEGVEPADQLMLLKNFLRALALRQGKAITFMPRWSEKADSQSAHIHISLKDKTGNGAFFDGAKPDMMSDTFRHFIGGLQKYAGDMMLVFAPTLNSYRRFAPGTFAPPGLTWGFENRTTCFRVVGHDSGSLRVENRLPGADSNPYLTVAATLAAGLAGIEGQVEPHDCVIGNGYGQIADELVFPHAMPEAILRFKASGVANEWLGSRFVECFAATRQSQIEFFARKVTDIELQRFFDLG